MSRNLRNLHAGCLLAALLIYTGSQIWQCVCWPPFYSFDETLEIDYVYQLTQGHLPTFFGGAEFNPLNMDYPYQVQWRYQHPPLFYLIEAPIFLLFDTYARPIAGIWAMRALVGILGVALILASAWTARWMFGKPCTASALVPLIVASNRCLPSVVLNYTLASLWVTLLIGMTCKLIRLHTRISTCCSVAWIVIVMLAPLTRLSTIPIMGLCLLTMVVGMLMLRIRFLATWLLTIFLPALLAILSSAWFYLRLYALSGSFTGSQPEWSAANLHRDTSKTFVEALLDPSFYVSSFAQFQNSTVTAQSYGWIPVLVLTVFPLVIAAVLAIRHLSSMRLSMQWEPTLIAAMLCVALLGTVFQQLLFYKQGGSGNAVYFSLISIVFAGIIAYGFANLPRMRQFVVCGWMLFRFAILMAEVLLNWPFRNGGTMAGRSIVWIGVTVFGLLLVSAGTAASCAVIARHRNQVIMPSI